MSVSRKLRWAFVALSLVVIGAIFFTRFLGEGDYASAPSLAPDKTAILEKIETKAPPASTQKADGDNSKMANDVPELDLTDFSNPVVRKLKLFQAMKTRKIDFYGRVVDQHGSPVSGAVVKADYAYYPAILKGDLGWETATLPGAITDSEGRFSYLGVEGADFSVLSIEKLGYMVENNGRKGFLLKRMKPEELASISSPGAPVIFKAWKKAKPEPLIEINLSRRIIPDGRRYTMDVRNGTLVEGEQPSGDVVLWITRSDVSPDGRAFSSEYHLAFNHGGGLVESTDPFRASAPEMGYLPSFSRNFDRPSQGRPIHDERKFYVTLGGGKQYGHASLRLSPAWGNKGEVARIYGRIILNPNGSRNLEYDAALVKKIRIVDD